MNVIDIPFVKKAGIQRTVNGALELPFTKDTQNHLQTIHAGAQFALAEASSGEMLQTLFPNLVGKVIPVLRESKIKFKKSANKNVYAHTSVSDESILKFTEQLSKKGRASISVEVEVKDAEGTVTCTGTYIWFVQSMEA